MIEIQSDIEVARRKLWALADPQQLAFGISGALNDVGYIIRNEVRGSLEQKFTLRNNWVKQGISVSPSTKQNLSVRVYSRDLFMGLQEFGGSKNPLKQYLAIPTSLVRRTKRELIRKSDRPKALGERLEVLELFGHKWLALKRTRVVRSGSKLRLMYLLIPRASIKARLGLVETAQRVLQREFGPALSRRVQRAIATAR